MTNQSEGRSASGDDYIVEPTGTGGTEDLGYEPATNEGTAYAGGGISGQSDWTSGGTTSQTDWSSGGSGSQSGGLTEKASEQMQQAGNKVTQTAMSQAESQKSRAAEGLDTAAQALRQTGQSLREQDRGSVAQYGDKAAEQVERLAGYLRQKDVSEMVDDVERFARRQPWVFLGGAFALGMLGARFLKSSGVGMPIGSSGVGGEHSVESSIEVNVPVHTAYNQWTQFEDFPHFMEGVEEVRQLDDQRLYWRAKIAGKTEEWYAVITEQVPDSRIAWRSTTGAPNSGIVTFSSAGAMNTRVTLRIGYQPEGLVETAGSALGLVQRRVQGDLQRFKEFIESRGVETGAWRGEIRDEGLGTTGSTV